MSNTKISSVLAKDLLSGAPKYLKNGYLLFDKVKIIPTYPRVIVEFYNSGELLAALKSDTDFNPGSDFTFEVHEGTMGMFYRNEDIIPTKDSDPKMGFDEWW
jgi:hypothetical protein